MNKSQMIFMSIVTIAFAIAVRSIFPKTIEVQLPPIMRPPVHDTVQVLDTVEITRWRERTKPDTQRLERITVTKPDTVYLIPQVTGLTALFVPQHPGDSMIAFGHQITPVDSGYAVRNWRAQWYATGPLKALVADSLPPIAAFWPAPRPVKSCGIFCKVGHYAVGGAIGYGVCELKH